MTMLNNIGPHVNKYKKLIYMLRGSYARLVKKNILQLGAIKSIDLIYKVHDQKVFPNHVRMK